MPQPVVPATHCSFILFCDLQNFFGPEFVKMTIEPFISLDLPKSILVRKGLFSHLWQGNYVKPTNVFLSQVRMLRDFISQNAD